MKKLIPRARLSPRGLPGHALSLPRSRSGLRNTAVNVRVVRQLLKTLTLHRCFIASVDAGLILATAFTLISVMDFIKLSILFELIELLARVLFCIF